MEHSQLADYKAYINEESAQMQTSYDPQFDNWSSGLADSGTVSAPAEPPPRCAAAGEGAACSGATCRDILVSEEALLLRHLLLDYEALVRPAFNASSTVVVRVGLSLSQLLDVDEKTQIVTTLVWLRQEWIDTRLQWNPDEFYGIKRLYVPSGLIWLPDIVLYNTMEITTASLARSRISLLHDGNISWTPLIKFSSACHIDITYFPFDDQICSLKMGSWSYDGFQVDVETLGVKVGTRSYVPNDEFELLDTRIVRQVSHYGCCPEPFPDVVAHFHLRRRTLHYVFNIVVPSFMLSLISLLSFLLSPEYNNQKIMIQLSTLLSFSFFKLVIVEMTPPTSDAVPLIGIYLTGLMLLTAMSTVAHMIAEHVVAAEDMKARVSKVCTKVTQNFSLATKSLLHCSCAKRKEQYAKYKHAHISGPTANSSNCSEKKECSATSVIERDGVTMTDDDHQCLPTESRHGAFAASNDSKGCASTNTHAPMKKELIQRALSTLRARQQAAADQHTRNVNWLKVAATVDKAFFITYLLVLAILMTFTLIVKPMHKDLLSA